MKRHCLEKCDEEGKRGDYITTTNNNNHHTGSEEILRNSHLASSPSNNTGTATATGSSNSNSKSDLRTATAPLSSASTFASAAPQAPAVECEADLDGIIATTESVLSHLWAKGVHGVSAGVSMEPAAAVLVPLLPLGSTQRDPSTVSPIVGSRAKTVEVDDG